MVGDGGDGWWFKGGSVAQGLRIFFFFFFSGALDPEKKKRDPSGDFGPSQFFLSFFLKGEREGMGVGGWNQKKKSRLFLFREDFIFLHLYRLLLVIGRIREETLMKREIKETLDTLGNCDERTICVRHTSNKILKETVLRDRDVMMKKKKKK